MTHPFNIQGKKILVTGASSGIGRAIAVACAEMGAEVIITGRNAEALAVTQKMMNADFTTSFVADLTNYDEVTDLVSNLPELDGIVSNAGINRRMVIQFLKEEALDNVIDTNLKSPIMLSKALLKAKKINSGASIVFISSIAAFHSSIGDGVYSASKGGLSSFAKVLAMELALKRMRVNTIQPGMVRTGLTENGPLSEADYQKDEQRYPLGRYGKPEDIAYAAVYLLSDAACWITGTDLVVDGGISLI